MKTITYKKLNKLGACSDFKSKFRNLFANSRIEINRKNYDKFVEDFNNDKIGIMVMFILEKFYNKEILSSDFNRMIYWAMQNKNSMLEIGWEILKKGTFNRKMLVKAGIKTRG